MKTAEEWAINKQQGLALVYTHNFELTKSEQLNNEAIVDFIKQIQHDAMMEAARITSDIAKLYDDMPHVCAALIKVPTAITTAASKLLEGEK